LPPRPPNLGGSNTKSGLTTPFLREVGSGGRKILSLKGGLYKRIWYKSGSPQIWGARGCFQTLYLPMCCEEDPPTLPLKRGENQVLVPLKKGDLGGSPGLKTLRRGAFCVSPVLPLMRSHQPAKPGRGVPASRLYFKSP
jgi:hypothetical protein